MLPCGSTEHPLGAAGTSCEMALGDIQVCKALLTSHICRFLLFGLLGQRLKLGAVGRCSFGART